MFTLIENDDYSLERDSSFVFMLERKASSDEITCPEYQLLLLLVNIEFPPDTK